jgi:asparagine synthetase B (glutamine-hydrolysing)
VEPRSPMLDFRLVDYVCAIPATRKLVDGNEKYLLKKAAEPYLPPEILNRRKQELAVPLEDWLTGKLGDLVHSTLMSEASLQRELFDPDRLKDFVKSAGRAESYALWTLFMLERWFQLLGVDR